MKVDGEAMMVEVNPIDADAWAGLSPCRILPQWFSTAYRGGC
jgi:hypothetical protein